jgi:hypothetical protein
MINGLDRLIEDSDDVINVMVDPAEFVAKDSEVSSSGGLRSFPNFAATAEQIFPHAITPYPKPDQYLKSQIPDSIFLSPFQRPVTTVV